MMVQSLFIAATKESLLVKDAFNEICSMIATGKITFPLVQAAASVNKQMNSVVVKDILKNTLHSYISYFGPQHYNAKVLSIPPENNWCINLKTRYMKRSKK